MKDPARLLDNPGSDLDVLLLESGLDEEPPSRIADRTLVALGVASAAAGAGAGAVGASAASIKAGAGTLGWWAGPWALVAKVGIGVAVVGGVMGGGYAVLGPPSPESGALVAQATTQGAPVPGSEASKPSPETTGAKEVVEPLQENAAEPAQPSDPATAATADGAAAARVADGSKAAKASEAPKSGTNQSGTNQPPTDGPAKPAKAADGGSTLAQERQLIDSARASLRNGDKAGAIATLDRYAGRFPKGQLKNEVAAMRQAILASP